MPTTTITNYSYFFNSADIKVFPCQNRGLIYNNENTSIGINDPEARMLSEYNFTHTTTDYMQSYAITKGDFDKIAKGEHTFCFVIGGYYFELKFTPTAEQSEIDIRKEMLKLYFHIRLKLVYIQETNAKAGHTRTSQELAPIVDNAGEVLLTSLDHNNKFYGIGLSSSEASSSSTYVIRFFDDNGNFIFTTLRPELSHGEQDNSTKIGSNLIASRLNQTVIGEYNTSNNEAVFIVGNGIANEKNNSIEVKTGTLQIHNNTNNITAVNTNTITGETNSIQAENNNIAGITNTIAATDKNIIKLTDTNYIEQVANLATIKNTNIKLDGMVEITGTATINTGEKLVVNSIESHDSNVLTLKSKGIVLDAKSEDETMPFTIKNIKTGTDNIASPVWFSKGTGENSGAPVIDTSNFTYNPSAKLLQAPNISVNTKITAQDVNIYGAICVDQLKCHSRYSHSTDVIWAQIAHGPNNDGDRLELGASGTTVIGAGEGWKTSYGLTDVYNNEYLYLVSDGNAYIKTGTDSGWNNGATYTFDTSGTLTATKFNALSDRRLKENIEDTKFDAESILDKIKIRDFTWKADEQHKQQVGVIAQELAEVMPEEIKDCFVDTTSETFSVSESKLVYLLIKAYQEEKAKRIEIENRLNKLEGRN